MASRLILVGGPGGGGSSTYAAHLAQALDKPVVLGALDATFGATQLCSAPHVELLGADAAEHGESDGMNSLVESLALNPRIVTEAHYVPGASVVRTLFAVGSTAGTSDAVIVIDVGSSIAEFALTAHQLAWLTHETLPAQRGWLSASKPLLAAGLGRHWPGSLAYEHLQRAWQVFNAAADLINRSEAHLIDRRGGGSDKVRHLTRGLRLAGVHDVVGQTKPHGGIEIRAMADGFDWCMPLPDFSIDQLTLQHSGDDLVLDGYGFHRVIRLSSVFRRLVPTAASLVEEMLTIRFRPPKETVS